jgi:protein-disulfide isomerase
MVCAAALVMGCGPVSAPAESGGDTAGAHRSTSEQLPVDVGNPVWGDEDAPVTVVAFLDFECPFCARGHDTVTELQRSYGPQQLRIVFKHAPLPFHERGMPAASAAQAVFQAQGVAAFLTYAARLFANVSELGDENLIEWAGEVGVPESQFVKLVASRSVAEQIERDLALAAELGVSGVPAFYINGAGIVGARPSAEFRAAIDHELRAALRLRDTGLSAGQVYTERLKVNLRPVAQEDFREDDQTAFVVPVGASPSLGADDAWVTIVEFADFECAYCRRIHPVVSALIARYPGRIRWVMKHNPLGFHQLAVPAALLALEVRDQRGIAAYWDVLDELFQAPKLTRAHLVDLAKRRGLDEQRHAARLRLGEADPQLIADRDLAMDLLAEGTPHFFINGRRLSGAQPAEQFETIIEQELEKMQTLSKSGPLVDPYAAVQVAALPPPGLVRLEIERPDASSPSLGQEDAPVVVQMFADFECGYCGRAMTTLEQIRRERPGHVRVVWRNLPLPFHAQARLAATAALALRAQRGDAAFWEMATRLFGSEEHPAERLTQANVLRHATELGADREKLDMALKSRVHDSVIDRDVGLATRLGISGTPTFVINGYQLVGAQPHHRFDRLVRLALANLEPPPLTSL